MDESEHWIRGTGWQGRFAEILHPGGLLRLRLASRRRVWSGHIFYPIGVRVVQRGWLG